VSEIAHSSTGRVVKFEPQAAKANDARADAVIEYAKRVKDWPALEQAVEHKIADQIEFVRWWEENVRPRGQGNVADRGQFSVEQVETITGITKQQQSRWRTRTSDSKIEGYREKLFGVAYREAMAGVTNEKGASGTGDNEWYTPGEYLAAARDVLGEIDLDPASSEAAQRVVEAKRFFSKEDNGLTQPWHGNVWLNPPYTQPEIAQFSSKMVEETSAGRVKAGIMLTHNYTDTAWFHGLAASADAICFTRGRVKFYNGSGDIAAPTQGQTFFYFGPDADGFSERFASIGFIAKPVTGEVK
jgi:phage N-6-adenine-methyltransferase